MPDRNRSGRMNRLIHGSQEARAHRCPPSLGIGLWAPFSRRFAEPPPLSPSTLFISPNYKDARLPITQDSDKVIQGNCLRQYSRPDILYRVRLPHDELWHQRHPDDGKRWAAFEDEEGLRAFVASHVFFFCSFFLSVTALESLITTQTKPQRAFYLAAPPNSFE